MEENQNKDGQLNIELDQEIAEGTYSNLAIINHSVSEFIVDFKNGPNTGSLKRRLSSTEALHLLGSESHLPVICNLL